MVITAVGTGSRKGGIQDLHKKSPRSTKIVIDIKLITCRLP